MGDNQEAPQAGCGFVPEIPNHGLERMDLKREQEDTKQPESSDEQPELREPGRGRGASRRHFSMDAEDDEGPWLSQYSSTLYDVAMEAVTQSLFSSRSLSSRKKSPAWKHFFISPRDSTKAICMYCMKEFSRGKNEKDLSTSCLMRHVRRAHPTVLAPENGSLIGSSCSPPALLLPAPAADTTDLSTVLSPLRLSQKVASEIPSPDRVTEESASVVSSEDVSSDMSVSERYGKEEGLVGPSPHLPGLHYDDAAEHTEERSLTVPKSAPGSRRRSAVWKHFYLSPLDSAKAVCIHCMNEFSRGKNGKDLGTSCLIRHMWRAHRSIVLQENGGGSAVPPFYSAPPTLLPSLLPSDAEFGSVSVLPGSLLQEVASASSSPDRLPEQRPPRLAPGATLPDDAAALSSSDDVGEALLASSPEKPGPGLLESGAVFQQNKKVMKRLKSEVWHHFSLAPMDSLKAVCRYCSCAISRGKKGDVGTSCLMRHLYRRHPEVVGNRKGFLSVSLANSPYATLASAESSSSKLADLPAVATKDNQVTFPVNSKKTSKLWNHFSICSADSTKVVCLHCGRTISRGKKPTNLGTSCLLRHLQRFHGHVLKNDAAEPAPSPPGPVPPSTEFPGAPPSGGTREKFCDSHPVAKKITSLVAEMLALDLQPYSFVDSVGFTRLLEYLKPQYALPAPSYFSRTAVPGMYEEVRRVVTARLREAASGVVHFTAGVWMSSPAREFLTLTAHWVAFEAPARPRGEERRRAALLDVSQVDGDYSGHSIQKQLEGRWEAWVAAAGLEVGITVTDSASVGKALNEGAHSSVLCFSHTVSLVVSEAIKSQRMVQNVLSAARKVCERVHRSPRAREKLAELQREYGLPQQRLLQDVPSRWSTSFHMLERLIEQKRAVNELSATCSFRELISCDQWEVMQSVCQALRPFEAASREMGARAATLGQVIPMVHLLSRKVEALFEETLGIDPMLRALREALLSRCSAALHDPRYVLATLLDPRYKASLFTDEEAEQYKQDLIRELETLTSTSADRPVSNGCDAGSPPRDPAGEENLWSLMAKVKRRDRRERAKLPEDMVLAYLEEEVLEHDCDPLTYWDLKRASWPALAALAVRFLGCPPSLVPAEQLFCTPTESGSFSQSRLMVEHFEKLIFLKVNLPLIYFQY